ncbi:MAG: hypothetical protein HY662_02515 [Chloroflexi bacterium]|nr:hypothetical protein [Chloroflexota bacterium]
MQGTYDQGLGRFISADTIIPSYLNPQSLNRYTYVYNNPLKYIDPTGHWGWSNITKWVGDRIDDVKQVDGKKAAVVGGLGVLAVAGAITIGLGFAVALAGTGAAEAAGLVAVVEVFDAVKAGGMIVNAGALLFGIASLAEFSVVTGRTKIKQRESPADTAVDADTTSMGIPSQNSSEPEGTSFDSPSSGESTYYDYDPYYDPYYYDSYYDDPYYDYPPF